MARTITHYGEAPQTLLQQRYSSLGEIPTEAYLRYSGPFLSLDPVDGWDRWSGVSCLLYLNERAFTSNPQMPMGNSPVMAGTHYDVVASYDGLVSDLTGETVLFRYHAENNAGNGGHNFFVEVSAETNLTTTTGLPSVFEASIPNVARTQVHIDGQYRDPGSVVIGLRPSADFPSDKTFIDQWGLPGWVEFELYRRSPESPGPVITSNSFAGILKRSAQNKTVAEILDSDIVLGTLLKGTRAAHIVNGAVLQEITLPAGARYVEARLSPYFRIEDGVTSTQWLGSDGLRSALYTDNAPIEGLPNYIRCYTSSTSILFRYSLVGPSSGLVTANHYTSGPHVSVALDLSECVLAFKEDTSPWENSSGDLNAQVSATMRYLENFGSPNQTEAMEAYVYDSAPEAPASFWANFRKAQENI